MHEIANRDIMSARKPENCLQISGKRRMLITIAAPAAYIKRVQEEHINERSHEQYPYKKKHP